MPNIFSRNIYILRKRETAHEAAAQSKQHHDPLLGHDSPVEKHKLHSYDKGIIVGVTHAGLPPDVFHKLCL